MKMWSLAIWLVVGILNLMSSEVSKLSYGLLWGLWMLHLITDVIIDFFESLGED